MVLDTKTVGEVIDSIQTFTDSERKMWLGPLIDDMFSPIAKLSLLATQGNMVELSEGDFGRFLVYLQAAIKTIVEQEMSEDGIEHRKMMGLEPLTFDTVIHPKVAGEAVCLN